jgi:hypothetical protein
LLLVLVLLLWLTAGVCELTLVLPLVLLAGVAGAAG